MTKKIFTLLFALLSYSALFGQNPGLVTSSSDVIGFSNYPASPLMIQSGPANFYWISTTSQGTAQDHPKLNKMDAQFANLFFIRYDELGTSTAANYLSGTSSIYASGAFSFRGGLTLVGSSYADVVANGNTLPINNASYMEFLASYNDLGQFERIVPVWDLEQYQYPNSRAMMDKYTGDLFLVGTASVPFNLLNHGILGLDEENYLYVLRYDRSLALTGVFTAGFANIPDSYANYQYYPAMITDGRGGIVISGTWDGNLSPVIGGDTLNNWFNETMGIYAFKLNSGFEKEWVLEGSLNGSVSESFAGISEGFVLPNGNVLMVGETPTGFFSLGDVKIAFETGQGSANQFAFILSPDGSPVWINTIENKDDTYYGKGTKSETFSTIINRDALLWKDQVLFLTGGFTDDALEVAGRILQKTYTKGAFVAAIDIRTGEELWGYSLSSDNIDLYGFDMDASGNISLMGRTSRMQDFEGLGDMSLDGSDMVFHIGLDSDGKLLWHNNALLEGNASSFYGTDLEVLNNGAVFASFTKNVFNSLLIGNASLDSNFDSEYSSVLVGLRADNLLGGKVFDKAGTPVYPGWVKAYKSTIRGAYPVIDSVQINDSGEYLFSSMYPGSYRLRAIPDLNQYPDGMPTYGGGAISWDAAKEYGVKPDTRTTFEDITLSEVAKLSADDGSGQLSGNISYSDDVAAKGTLSRPSRKTAVILVKKAASKGTQEGNVVAYLDTDDEGNFVFENVPDGEYGLIIDLPGLPMNGNYEIVVVGNIVVSGLDFEVNDQGINPTGTVGVESLEMEQLIIFPNPGNGMIHIMIQTSGDYLVQVFNSVGQMVETRSYFSVSGLINLDLSALDSGMYLIKLDGNKGSKTVKYMRR